MLPRLMEWLIHALDLHTFAPADLLTVLILIVLEGLLSCDNAVVLALLVKDLPPEQRGKALRYGIIGAYVFRIAALFLALWVMTIWWIKVVGGIYLAWLAIDYFRRHGGAKETSRQVKVIWGLGAFWSTVVWVELTDIVFSVDSIAAAVALSKQLWVLILGGLLGILAMRFAAQGFVTLLQRFPRLESAAFAAVGVIGLKLLLEVPVDIFGHSHQLPSGATYQTAAQYIKLAESSGPKSYGLRHVFTINRSAPPAPLEEAFLGAAQAAAPPELSGPARDEWIASRAASEYKDAKSTWVLHLRPWIEIEGWASSLLVLSLFGLGFMPKRKRT